LPRTIRHLPATKPSTRKTPGTPPLELASSGLCSSAMVRERPGVRQRQVVVGHLHGKARHLAQLPGRLTLITLLVQDPRTLNDMPQRLDAPARNAGGVQLTDPDFLPTPCIWASISASTRPGASAVWRRCWSAVFKDLRRANRAHEAVQDRVGGGRRRYCRRQRLRRLATRWDVCRPCLRLDAIYEWGLF
jgi:hypothetical protein